MSPTPNLALNIVVVARFDLPPLKFIPRAHIQPTYFANYYLPTLEDMSASLHPLAASSAAPTQNSRAEASKVVRSSVSEPPRWNLAFVIRKVNRTSRRSATASI